MKLHANARTCPNSRRLLVERVLDGGWSVREAAADRAGEAVAARPARACEPLRTPAAGRARPCRHQKARPLPTAGPSRHRPRRTPPHPPDNREGPRSRRRRLGLRPCLRRRRDQDRLRRGFARRARPDRRPLSRTGRRLVLRPRRPGRAGHDRQRLLLRLQSSRRHLPRARAAPPPHTPLQAPHERKGGALHPDAAKRTGLRARLHQLRRTPPTTPRPAPPLQLPQTTRLTQPQAPGSSPPRPDRNDLTRNYT